MFPTLNAYRRGFTLLATALCLLWGAVFTHALEPTRQMADSETAGTPRCRECHDHGSADKVQALLQGSHGISAEAGFEKGCEDCHGASAAHASAPREVSPATSFGPRWSASGAAQDRPCLHCHESETQANWQHALHMLNALTCVTCHDIHQDPDRVLFDERQAEVCTMCHKAQKSGIHGIGGSAGEEPPCSSCHNPHDHETAQARMSSNQSAGCRHCHDLAAMAEDPTVNTRANDYHRSMEDPGRTCLECHQGTAHPAPAGTSSMAASTTGLESVAVAQKTVTLFYPGMADSDWLLQAHPGSQPLRQGTRCQRCHRGEEAALGDARAGGSMPGSRDIQVTVAVEGDQLRLDLQWRGPSDDTTLALMWGDGSDSAFSRGGCFAACHSDLPGMSRDQGNQTDKYLRVSGPAPGDGVDPDDTAATATTQALLTAGNYAELWQIDLKSTTLKRGLLFDSLRWQPNELIEIKKSDSDDQWSVTIRAKMHNTGGGVSFAPGGVYTFGIALNGAANPGSKHWVSLPLTLSFGGNDTDFTAE